MKTAIQFCMSPVPFNPFDTEIIWKAFDIDPNAQYGDYDATYAEVIQTMAGALSGTFDEK